MESRQVHGPAVGSAELQGPRDSDFQAPPATAVGSTERNPDLHGGFDTGLQGPVTVAADDRMELRGRVDLDVPVRCPVDAEVQGRVDAGFQNPTPLQLREAQAPTGVSEPQSLLMELTDDGGGGGGDGSGDVQRVTVELETVQSHRGVFQPESFHADTCSLSADDKTKLPGEKDTSSLIGSLVSAENAASVTIVARGEGADWRDCVDDSVAEPLPERADDSVAEPLPGAGRPQERGDVLQPSSAAPVLAEPALKIVCEEPEKALEVSGLSARSSAARVVLLSDEPSTAEAVETCSWSGGDGGIGMIAPSVTEQPVLPKEAGDSSEDKRKAETFKSEVVFLNVVSGKVSEISHGLPTACSGEAGKTGVPLQCEHTAVDGRELSEPCPEEGGSRGKRPESNGTGNLGLKEVEFKLDIGKRRLPSPDVKKAAEKERAPEFVVKPRRQFVDEGQNAKFKLSFEGSPNTQLSWSKDGKPLPSGSKFKTYEQAGYHYLEVCNVTANDSGMYVGTVQNSAGTDTASAELDVFEKPKLLTRGPPAPTLSTSLQDMDVVIGDRDVKLKCEVTGGDDCMATWYHNGREVRQGRRHRCRFNGQQATLTLTEIGEEDGGLYECVLANSTGEVRTSCTLTTQEGEKFEPPVFIKELQDMEVEDGDKVELVVEVKGSQPIQVYWIHNNCQVTVDSPGCLLRAVDGVHSLLVPRATADNSGEYVCEAYNEYGDTDTFCRLAVKEVVDKPDPPEFLTRPKLVTVLEGEAATFTCHVKGHPLPAVWWERNGCKLSTDENYKVSSAEGDRHSLEVLRAHKSDAGQYVCHVHNKAGSVTHTCSLIVTPAASNSQAAPALFRALLRPSRQPVGQIGSQSSTESERSDKENNELRGLRSLLRNNRQTTPPRSNISATPTPTTTAAATTTTATARLSRDVKPKTAANGTWESPSPSATASGASTRAGGVRRNLDLFESRSSASPERSSLAARQSASPAADRTRTSLTPERRGLSPAQESPKPSPLQERIRQSPVQESPVSRSRAQPSQAAPGFYSKDRYDKDPSPYSSSQTDSPKGGPRTDSTKSDSVIDSRKSDSRTDSRRSDFRSVLSNRKDLSPQPEDKKNGHSKDVKTVDFRSVLKNRQTGSDSKPSAVTKDSKANVQSRVDFRSVLAKIKNGGDEKQNGVSNSVGTRSSRHDAPLNKALSKDINSIKSRFETPAGDFRSVQLKPSKPQPTDQQSVSARADTDPAKKPADWRTARTRDTTTATTTTTTTDFTTRRKQPDASSSLNNNNHNNTSRFSDTPKHSDSSQWSDSAISSAFSRLSEFSDLSDGASPRSEVASPAEVATEPRSRRRLERLRGEGVGWGARKAEDPSEAPSIQGRLENQRVRYGAQAVFQCRISGVPPPDINWSVNHKAIKPSKFFQLSYTQNIAQLVVAEAFSEDEGEYTCTATNNAGTDSCSCYLTVEASSSGTSRSGSHSFEGPVSIPPRVLTLTPSNVTVRRGQPIRLNVSFTGSPAPVVKWFLAKTELTSDDHFTIMSDTNSSSLSISSTGASDGGRYTVTITNDLGTDLQSANVSIEDVPEPPVGRPHVYDVSRQSVSLSWCGPAYDGGCAVSHYTIEVRDSCTKRWATLITECQSTSYHALNLAADRSYEFRVRACNKLGLSEPSLATETVVMMDPLHSSEDYESDGCSEVFSPTLDYRGRDELPFEPRDVALAPGRKFEDHYEYLHEVGRGKFGSVYKCKEKATGKIWAAKVLKVREKDKDNVRLEVAIMNKLAHPKLLMLWDAFEAPRTMVLVMEYVGAGELFERVIRDDFVLTERDCVHFVRQICTGVGYMHSQGILHLDLKPENVLCVADNSNQIKIIDFGLARFYKPGESCRVLFGTPEFIAPEVINYDEISYATDLWSIGVICYILLSGLSPFLGDNDAETLANVTSGEYDFDDESFEDISDCAKDFIGQLLVKRKEKRSTIDKCQKHPWLAKEDHRALCKRLNTDRLRCFMARRKWQKAGNAFRALGRMASLQKLLSGGSTSQSSSGSLSSIPDTPTPATPAVQSGSGSGLSTPVMAQSSVFADPLSSTPPLAVGKVLVEDKEEEEVEPAASTASAATTSADRGASLRHKGGNRLAGHTDTDGSSAVTGRTAAAPAGQTAPPSSSPSSRRRAWEEAPSGGRLGPGAAATEPATAAGTVDATDGGAKDSVRRNSPNNHLPRVKTNTNTNTNTTDSNGFSPSQARRRTKGGGGNDDDDNNNKGSCPPSFVKEMVDCTAFAGDVVRFDVKVTGQPAPQLEWTLEEEVVEEDHRHILELGENGLCSLIVRHVTEDDEGEYSCRAVNSRGEATCSAELSLYGTGAI